MTKNWPKFLKYILHIQLDYDGFYAQIGLYVKARKPEKRTHEARASCL